MNTGMTQDDKVEWTIGKLDASARRALESMGGKSEKRALRAYLAMVDACDTCILWGLALGQAKPEDARQAYGKLIDCVDVHLDLLEATWGSKDEVGLKVSVMAMLLVQNGMQNLGFRSETDIASEHEPRLNAIYRKAQVSPMRKDVMFRTTIDIFEPALGGVKAAEAFRKWKERERRPPPQIIRPADLLRAFK